MQIHRDWKHHFLLESFLLTALAILLPTTSQAIQCDHSPSRFTYFENDRVLQDNLGVEKTELALRYQSEFSSYKVASFSDNLFLIQFYEKVVSKKEAQPLSIIEAQKLNQLNRTHKYQEGETISPESLEKIFIAINYYLAQKKASQSAYFYKSLDKEAVLQESVNSLSLVLRNKSLREKIKNSPEVFYSAFYRQAAKWINRLRFDQYSGGSQRMKLNEGKLIEYVNFNLLRRKLEQKNLGAISQKILFDAAKEEYPQSKFTESLESFNEFMESVKENQDGYKNYMEVWQIESDMHLAGSSYLDIVRHSKDLTTDTFESYRRKLSDSQIQQAISKTSRISQTIIALRFFQAMSRDSVHEIISYWLNIDIPLERYRALERRAFISLQKELELLL